MDKIIPCLWFDNQAEEAARYYVSLLPGATIDAVIPSPVDNPGTRKGEPVLVEFTLAGQNFQALNGGPFFKPTGAVSLSVSCADQAEVDRLWDGLLDGGQPMECGWITDRYGYSWQIVPEMLSRLLRSGEPPKVEAMFKAMLQMVKLDIATLQAAYDAG